jgi:MFS transporter, FSR family, fosmidomycin resistance protein
MSSIALPASAQPKTAIAVLGALSFCHFLNDLMQSLLPALYPLLKASYALSFAQIGWLTATFQLTGSVLQPLVGNYTDKKPLPYSLAVGMGFSGAGLLLLAWTHAYAGLLLGAALIGVGSSIFHPESSRIARLASGGRHGFAQSVFQVGGNLGSSAGPLLAAFIVVTRGQSGVGWFALLALLGMVLLLYIGHWYRQRQLRSSAMPPAHAHYQVNTVTRALLVLLVLMFAKYFYLASMGSYYTFYLIEKFGLSIASAQVHLFVFLGSVAAGTLIGGPIGDRIGRNRVIWISILGILPFTLVLPHANLFWTTILTVPIGMILASAFPAMVVYGQELLPGKVGTIAGLFFGVAFGLGALGAAALGALADRSGVEFVYQLCAWLPVLGLGAFWLPKLAHSSKERI